jgi:hypothetical protein
MVTNSNDSLARKVDFFQEYRIIRADGELRHLRSKATYLEDHNSSGPNILGVNIDITDDVEKSVGLEKARAEMELEGSTIPSLDLQTGANLIRRMPQLLAMRLQIPRTPHLLFCTLI